jgi:hypothetical protein
MTPRTEVLIDKFLKAYIEAGGTSSDLNTEAFKQAVQNVESDVKEVSARTCEAMIVTGHAWSEEQALAADVLSAAAKAIRTDALATSNAKTFHGFKLSDMATV